MLIEFSLANHRSFASEQTLSLVASKLKDEHPNRIAVIEGAQRLSVLTTAILLGKNGSGKSTLVDAMGFVRTFVRTSSSESQQGEPIEYAPNRIEKGATGQDTSFRVVFSMHDVVYQFEFSIDALRVTSESLMVADRSSRFRRIYERTLDKQTNEYSFYFADDLRGDKAVWRAATRDNSLFLSTAVQLNAQGLQAPFDWLSKYFRAIDATSPYTDFTAGECLEPEHKARILEFLKRLDINIVDVMVDEEEIDDTFIRETFNPEFLKKLPRSFEKSRRVRFVHENSEGERVDFELNDESTGTKALFGLAGPIFDTLAHGYCLVVDEVNTSLHPLVFHALIDAFSDPSLNTKRAQLVFTSHDTSLLRDSYFRRDQIWFVDTDRLGRTSLIPLSDYSPRKGEALERGYLGGRYGGVPSIAPRISEAPSKREPTTA